MHHPTTWVEIDARALAQNINTYKSLTSTGQALALVVKSNAYGHGMVPVARLAQKHKHIAFLATASLSEALTLRDADITKPILVLGYCDAPLESAIINNIALVCHDLETLRAINSIAARLNKKASVHLKIDTGLSRLGYLYTDAHAFIDAAARSTHCSIIGMCTHLADSENEDQRFVTTQQERLDALVEYARHQGISPSFIHSSCSAAASVTSHGNLIRLGIGAYGLWPSDENKQMTLVRNPATTLSPVLTWKTRVINVKTIPAGSTVGYDRTYQATKPTTIAVLPVGYWEGYDRGFSNQGIVMINNQPAPVVGRISMNITTVNITGINARIGDEVTLLGNREPVTVQNLAQKLDTIHYEVITRINPNIPRIILNS